MSTEPARDYQQRKEASLCTRCGAPAAEDSSLCPEHRDDLRKRRKKWIRNLRKRRKKAGLCMYCPSSRSPNKVSAPETSCLPCRIRRNRVPPTVGVDGAVDNGSRAAAISAATRKDPDGRTRYHGQQRRGQQTHAQLNEQDLRLAASRWDPFSAGVTIMGSEDAKAWHRGQREAVKEAVCRVGEQLSGHIDDILERLGHFKARHGRRDGDG